MARLDDMEQRVTELREENERLKSHLVNVTQKKADLRRQKTAMQMEMYRLFSSESSPENHYRLYKLLQEYTELNGDYGASRQKEVSTRCTYINMHGLRLNCYVHLLFLPV
jgi:predicted  nucleic acid-binding Zn-ribbon protein